MASGVVHKPRCCTSTIAPALNKKAEPVYSGPTTLALGTKVYLVPSASVNRAIKCQQIPGGDRYATIGDGTRRICPRWDRCPGSQTLRMNSRNAIPEQARHRVFGQQSTTNIFPGGMLMMLVDSREFIIDETN